MKTALDVLQDVKAMLQGSELEYSINGSIYFEGTRPKDSTKEDAVLVYTQGTSRQVEQGTITILVFVPDLPQQGGHTAPNLKRIIQIERKSAEWVQTLRGSKSRGYLFRVVQAIAHYPQPEIKQHFVSLKLDYKYFDGTNY